MKSIFDLERQMYKEGSRVNEAGNYTKPGVRKNVCLTRLKRVAKAVSRVSGLRVKLRFLAKQYKDAGGGYT